MPSPVPSNVELGPDVEGQQNDQEKAASALSEVNSQNTIIASEDDTGKRDAEQQSDVVWWDEPAECDPYNPMAWPLWKKWTNISIMSAMTFLAPFASSMLAPAIPDLMADLHEESTTFAIFAVSIFVLGFAAGPLVVAPLREIYGRVIVYNVSNVLFVGFTIMCALADDSGMILAARFWAGAAGVSTVACGSGTIADLMPPAQRGRTMAWWSAGPMLGPVIGPIVGGYLVEAKSWRWVFWVNAILAGIVTLLGFAFFRETYAPVLLERKAARLRKETGNPNLRSKLASDKSRGQFIKESIRKPLEMLITLPIVSMMSTYIAVLYGCLYTLFCTFIFVFEDQYGFSSSGAGLTFIGSGVGSFAGLIYGGIVSDRIVKTRQADGKAPQPEDRLPYLLTIPAVLSLPAGLFMYGWSAQYRTYLIDAYSRHAASVVAAGATLRSVLGGTFPIFGLKLYNAIGLGWGNNLLAFICLAMAPMPILFRVFGEIIRQRGPQA